MFSDQELDRLLAAFEPLLLDSDRFKLCAGIEMLIGVLRGMGNDALKWKLVE
jgi:hypothetical protein